MILNNLTDTSRISRSKKRVGRGTSSGRGKTCSRGHKGSGSRSGYKRRHGYEGGQMRLYTKLPIRGFTRGRFAKAALEINLSKINQFYNDGEVVNLKTLYEKKIITKKKYTFLKVLGNGEIDKKVTIEAHSFSESSLRKLDEKKIKYTSLLKND
ncbi:MAG: 50S ribosomal protein L15 [Parachlamydiales bacterium]|nr:50S ribosomal protein L15 [Parachlamydiales bacterium]